MDSGSFLLHCYNYSMSDHFLKIRMLFVLFLVDLSLIRLKILIFRLFLLNIVLCSPLILFLKNRKKNGLFSKNL